MLGTHPVETVRTTSELFIQASVEFLTDVMRLLIEVTGADESVVSNVGDLIVVHDDPEIVLVEGREVF